MGAPSNLSRHGPLRRSCILATGGVILAFLLVSDFTAKAHDPNLTAVYEFSAILEKDPDHLEALRARGSTYRALELYDNALIDLKHADELMPGDPEVIAEIGICHYALGEREQASVRMDEAERLLVEKIRSGEWEPEKYAPIERELREYRFRNFREEEKYEEALAESRLLEKYLSGKLSFTCDMADILLQLGRASEALALYEKAVEANCAFERYCVGAANCRLLLEQPEAALEVFEAWKADDPTAGLPHLHHAFIYKAYLKDEERAREALARAEEAFHRRIDGEEEPDLEDVIHLARVLQIGERYEESWALLDKLIEDFRGHWLVVHLQGRNAAGLGREREAQSFERESRLYRRLNPRDWLQAYDIIPPPEVEEAKPPTDEADAAGPGDATPQPRIWWFVVALAILFLFWTLGRKRSA